LSKLSLNGLTIAFADEFKGKVSVNAMTLEWLSTRMGGTQAPRSVKEGADTIFWLATVHPSLTGKFFRDRQETSW